MKRSILFLVLSSLFSSLAAQYAVRGGSGQPLSAAKNGITEVYLLNGLSGAQISFTSSTAGAHQWYKFSQSIDDAKPVSCTQTGNTSVISGIDIQDGYGYYVASPLGAGYIWIVDYSRYVPTISGLQVMEDEYRCEQLRLIANAANINPIYYYTNGMRNTLERKFLLTYNTLAWNDEQKIFMPVDTTLVFNENQVASEILIDAPPLADTNFALVDSFSSWFGIAQPVHSDDYKAVAVKAYGFAETTKENADNEVHHAGDVLGGSAPIVYTFTAYANEPVAASYIWTILQQDSITKNMTQIVRYTDKLLQYPFEHNGLYHVELDVSDRESVCIDTTQFFDIVIDNTVVKIPNAFSPGSSIGVNDELRISFTSVITFKASVYNRWGNLLFQWNDPAKGWDGRVNGKFVPTGVYYVIVEYKDSTGKNRSMSRAVNVLRAKD